MQSEGYKNQAVEKSGVPSLEVMQHLILLLLKNPVLGIPILS